MRSRILVTAFLVFGTAGAGTLLARGIAGAGATGGGDGAAMCCPSAAGGTHECGNTGSCEKGCCKDGACPAGCCGGQCMSSHHAAMSSTASGDRQWSIVNFMNTVRVGRAFVSGTVLIVHDNAKMARGEPCTTFYRFDPSKGPRDALVSFHCKPRRAAAVAATTFKKMNTGEGVDQLTEYQLAGDSEAHGIPR
jgi:hypothetical protein